MRKVAGEHPFCVLIYMNSYIFHICFFLCILLSHLIFDFVCLTLSSADTHGIAKYARTYIRDTHTQAHTHKKKKAKRKSRKIRKIRKKKEKKEGKPQKKKRWGVRKERKKKEKKKGRKEKGQMKEENERKGKKGKKKKKKTRNEGGRFRGVGP